MVRSCECEETAAYEYETESNHKSVKLAVSKTQQCTV